MVAGIMPLLSVRLLCIFFLICPVNIVGIWWAVGSPLELIMDPTQICRKSRRLGGKQRQICRDESELIQEVAYGTRVALEVCGLEFKDRQWNCASARPSELRGLVKTLKLSTRETAYLNAISAAGVLYAITQGCSSGRLEKCSCDPRKLENPQQKSWNWEGCSDNVNYGYRKSKHFNDIVTDATGSDVTLKLQLHNNEAGRLAIRKHMITHCKCHGLSGSCTMKACWQRMPSLKSAGERLKDRFNAASKVEISNDGNSLIPFRQSNNARRSRGRVKKPRKHDLVYTRDSPNYCELNKKLGSLGTSGRDCNPLSQGTDGCALMCCGRGYTNRTINEVENCNCIFEYCCEVICDTCEVHKNTYNCN